MRSSQAEPESFPLADELSVAAFYDQLVTVLVGLDIQVDIKAEPYGISETTPFAEDSEHALCDREAV